MNRDKPRKKNYTLAFVFFKLLQPVFGVLFYAAIFFIALSLILCVIIFFVNVDVEQMLLPPFMHKIVDDTDKITAYSISFGNGIKVVTDADSIALGDIKAVIFSGVFALVCTLLTVAPVFKFLSMLLKNINSGIREKIIDEKNPVYVMYIGLCVFFGNILIRFVLRFYNYYLAARFIKGTSQEIKLSLGIDILSGITGLAILFIGLVFAYIFQHIRNMANQP